MTFAQRTWIIALLCWTALHAHAGARFERLAPDQSGARQAVHDILQDRQGFLWIATDDGLKKYDGYRFIAYRHEPFDAHSISSDEARFIAEDGEGSLWIIAGGALNRFDRETERFHRYSGDGETAPMNPFVIFCDRSGVIWVGDSRDGLFRYRRDTDRFDRFANDPDDEHSLSDNQVTALFLSSVGELWAATRGGGLNRYNAYAGNFDRFLENPDLGFDLGFHHIPRNLNNSPIIEDEWGHLWIVTYGGGLIRFDANNETFVQYLHDPNDANSIGGNIVFAAFRDSRGLIWLATGDGGVDRFDPKIERFRRFRADPRDPNGLPATALIGVSIAEDVHGNVWFGAKDLGLAMFERGPERFRRFSHSPREPDSISGNQVATMTVDLAENLWIGTANGLNKYSPHKQKFNVTNHSAFFAMDGRPLAIGAICEDGEGDLWIGVRGQGLIRYDPRAGLALAKHRADPDDPARLSSDYINAIAVDRDGAIWAGSRNGLHRFDPGQGSFRRYARDFRRNDSLRSNDIRSLFIDEDGVLWVGSARGGLHRYRPESASFEVFAFERSGEEAYGPNAILGMADGDNGRLWAAHEGGGLHRLDKASGRVRTYRHDLSRPSSLSHDSVSSVLRDSQGRIWAAALGGGLNLHQPETDDFRCFTQNSHGLPSNAIYQMAEDADGRIWLSLNNGLAQFDPVDETVKSYDAGDGLLGNSPAGNALSMGRRNRIYFGGIGGFNDFNPLQLPHNPHPPPVAVTGFKKLDQTMAREIAAGETIPISYRDNYFSIEFAALDFTYPAKNRYAYKLEGFDREWIYKQVRTAEYTNLDDGAYVFRVKAANNDGIWNEAGFSFTVDIAPPFWRTWWFYALEAIAVALLLALAFVYQLRRLQRQKRKELERAEWGRKLQELEYARELQLSMLPNRDYESEILDIFGEMRTATEVGGDYFDYFKLDEDRLCLAIGDATGHGLAAGLVVGMTKLGSALWTRSSHSGLARMLQDLNTALKQTLPRKNVGMGLGAAVIDTRRMQVELAFAGMPYPYHYRAADRRLKPLVMKGPPLGFLSRIHVQSCRVDLAPGDCLVFLSDGIPERFNDQNQLWGSRALEASLAPACRDSRSAERIAKSLLAACDQFANGRDHEDDMTVLALRVKQRAAVGGEPAKKDGPGRLETDAAGV